MSIIPPLRRAPHTLLATARRDILRFAPRYARIACGQCGRSNWWGTAFNPAAIHEPHVRRLASNKDSLAATVASRRRCLRPPAYIADGRDRCLNVQLSIIPTPGKDYMVLTVSAGRRVESAVTEISADLHSPIPRHVAAWVVCGAPRGHMESNPFSFVCRAFDDYFGAHARWAV